MRTMTVVASERGAGGPVKTPTTYAWMKGSGLVARGVDVSVEADGESSVTAPAAFLDESDVVDESKQQSLAALASSVKSHIQNLAR